MKRKVEQAVYNNDEIAVETAIYAYAAAKKLKTEQNGQVYDFSGEGLQKALNTAAENGCYEVFLRLLKAKAMGDITAGIDLSIPLFKAAEKGHLALIEHILMLWNHSKIIRSEEIHLACHLACREGHFNLVKWFFANKTINVNHEAIIGANKTTMLLSAIVGRHYELAFHLLDHSDLDPTSLEYAGLRASYEQLFDEYLFDNNQLDGNIDLVEAILNHPKIDPTFEAQYPFRVACSLNFSQTVADYLKDPKINPLLATPYYLILKTDGNWYKSSFNDDEMDPLLEMLPNDPRIPPHTQAFIPLIQVCSIGSFETLLVILEHTHSDPSLGDNFLLELACFKGHTPVVNLLLQDPRVLQILNLNKCMEVSIQYQPKMDALFETLLDNSYIESMLTAKPALFGTLIQYLLSENEDPYENVQTLLTLVIEKIKNLEASEAINPKEAISQEIWIGLFNKKICLLPHHYKWIHGLIDLEALNKIEFYTEHLKNMIYDSRRVAFCVKKASHLIPQQAILSAFQACLKSDNIETAIVLKTILTQFPDPSFIIETLHTTELEFDSRRFDQYAKMLVPLLPETTLEKQDEILCLAWEKNSLHLIHFLLHHYGLNPAADNFTPIFLVYSLWSSSLNGSDADSVNFEKAKKILHKLCNHPAVNTEMVLQSQEENADFKLFLEKVLSDKPGFRVRSLLLEKYKLLTLFGACNPNPPEGNIGLQHSFAVKNYFS